MLVGIGFRRSDGPFGIGIAVQVPDQILVSYVAYVMVGLKLARAVADHEPQAVRKLKCRR